MKLTPADVTTPVTPSEMASLGQTNDLRFIRHEHADHPRQLKRLLQEIGPGQPR